MRLTNLRNQVIADLSHVDIKILQKKPNPDSWSCIQILDHLVLSERLSLQYITKKYPAIEELPEAGLKQSVLLKVMTIGLKTGKKIKAPAVVAQPQAGYTLEEVDAAWQGVQDELKDFLEAYPEQYFHKSLYKHPFIGRLTLSQMMDIHLGHILRHQKQINRTIRDVGNQPGVA